MIDVTEHFHGSLELTANFEKTVVLFAGPTLPARDHPRSVHVALLVRNNSAEPIEFTFATTQRFEIELANEHGTIVTRWSQGQLFGQMVSTLALLPHHSWTFKGDLPLYTVDHEWIPSGRYTTRIYLTADRQNGAQSSLELVFAP